MQALIDLSYEIGDRLRNDLLMRVAHRVLFDERVFDLVAAGQFISWIAIVRDLLTKVVATGELCDGVDVGSAAQSIIADPPAPPCCPEPCASTTISACS